MKPKLLAVSATDTVPVILCVAAAGSDPARGSDTSAAAAMLSSKLFFDGAGTHRPLPERKAGHISVLSGGSSADGAGAAGTVDYRNGQAWKKFRLSGGIASFARQWSTGIQLRRRPKRCRAAKCEGRQGAMVCLRPKRRGLLHPLSVQGVHAYGRPMAL